MTFGFERELLLFDAEGKVIEQVPSRFPRDASQKFVEVRSRWYPAPNHTLFSFVEEFDRLSRVADQNNYILQVEEGYTFLDGYEPAGFHVHFGAYCPIDMPLIIKAFDERFKKEILAAQRTLGAYRMKPHGFEYRSLPATIDSIAVTQLLIDLNL